MKRFLTGGALALALALSASPAVMAKGKKKKPSAEHVAAVKKCKEDYTAAIKATKTLKGKEKKDAVAKAKADEKQCIAAAPQ
ncbi:MAG TPA: hypothetical protein VEV81_15920 [Pyrinomonadaceae bacterium]|nr:hypothetical protein [Pyrinomonadaceae bacterium]